MPQVSSLSWINLTLINLFFLTNLIVMFNYINFSMINKSSLLNTMKKFNFFFLI